MSKGRESDFDRYRVFLLDLDGTLVDVDMSTFFPVYESRLVEAARPLIEPSRFRSALARGVQAMFDHRDNSSTNQEAFMDAFFAGVDVTPEETYALFERFYREEFDTLSVHSRPIPHARMLIETLKDRQADLVLATNPVFPAVAVRSRMAWGGLSIDDFSLITTYEMMHATKPHPAYYSEILNMLGVGPDVCLMVGDDPVLDGAAMHAGIDTWLVTDRPGPTSEDATYAGPLSDLLRAVRTG